MSFPSSTEAAEYYFRYINLVHLAPGQDITALLATQRDETLAFLATIDEARSTYRYAPEKWSVRDVLAHISDAERVFAFRAWWFARGVAGALPGFDENPTAVMAAADTRTWASLVDEFRTVRDASLSLFKSLPEDAWSSRGVASGHPVTVRALAYITAGHLMHHDRILREKYMKL